MKEIETCGQAFPNVSNISGLVYQGMTLRDYFAGQALMGGGINYDYEDVGSVCYKYADAMLKERGKDE